MLLEPWTLTLPQSALDQPERRAREWPLSKGREPPVKRTIAVLFAALVVLVLTASSASAGVNRNVVWRCTPTGGETVDFVVAPESGFHGLSTADAATARADIALDETCEVVRV